MSGAATWIAIAVLALAALALGLLISREARRVWALLAAALVFALAAYAWQGSPDVPGAPQPRVADSRTTSDQMIEARRRFYNVEGIIPSRYVVIADGFSRRGQYADAAGLLRNCVIENGEDGEAWLALALALAEHTGGRITPPVGFAFERAREASPGNLAPAYFRGLIALRGGALAEARTFWVEGLEAAPEDARSRDYVAQQLERLDGVIGVLGDRAGQPSGGMPPVMQNAPSENPAVQSPPMMRNPSPGSANRTPPIMERAPAEGE